jgi:hypothetical protein
MPAIRKAGIASRDDIFGAFSGFRQFLLTVNLSQTHALPWL